MAKFRKIGSAKFKPAEDPAAEEAPPEAPKRGFAGGVSDLLNSMADVGEKVVGVLPAPLDQLMAGGPAAIRTGADIWDPQKTIPKVAQSAGTGAVYGATLHGADEAYGGVRALLDKLGQGKPLAEGYKEHKGEAQKYLAKQQAYSPGGFELGDIGGNAARDMMLPWAKLGALGRVGLGGAEAGLQRMLSQEGGDNGEAFLKGFAPGAVMAGVMEGTAKTAGNRAKAATNRIQAEAQGRVDAEQRSKEAQHARGMAEAYKQAENVLGLAKERPELFQGPPTEPLTAGAMPQAKTVVEPALADTLVRPGATSKVPESAIAPFAEGPILTDQPGLEMTPTQVGRAVRNHIEERQALQRDGMLPEPSTEPDRRFDAHTKKNMLPGEATAKTPKKKGNSSPRDSADTVSLKNPPNKGRDNEPTKKTPAQPSTPDGAEETKRVAPSEHPAIPYAKKLLTHRGTKQAGELEAMSAENGGQIPEFAYDRASAQSREEGAIRAKGMSDKSVFEPIKEHFSKNSLIGAGIKAAGKAIRASDPAREKLYTLIQQNAQTLGRYAPALLGRNGDKSKLETTIAHKLLFETDPEYRMLYKKLRLKEE